MVNTNLLRTHKTPLVQTRKSWADPWVDRTDLYCTNCEFTLNSIGSASFIRYHGFTLASGDSSYSEKTPLDLLHHWVKVTIEPTDSSQSTLYWYGLFVGEDVELFGNADADQTGNQHLQALSPEYLLSRIQLCNSLATNRQLFADGQINSFDFAASFNTFKSDRSGNRLQAGNKDPVRTYFAQDLGEAVEWTAKDILKYLTAYAKTNLVSVLTPLRNVQLYADMDNDLDFTPIAVPAQGATIFEVLSTLFNPSRGLAWRCVARSTESGFAIKVFSIADSDLTVDQDTRLVAAKVKKPFSLSGRNDVRRCALQTSTAAKYDQVIVEGGPLGAVFTASIENGALQDDWTTTEANKYRFGKKDDGDYGSLGYVSKFERNDAYRKTSELAHVYRRYRLLKQFDEILSDVNEEPLFPDFQGKAPYEKELLSFLSSQTIWPSQMRIQQYLPLIENVDYSKDAVADPNDSLRMPEFRRPMVFAKPKAKSDTLYELTRQSVSSMDNEAAPFKWSAHLEVHQHQLSLTINPTVMPHCLQGNELYDGKGQEALSETQARNSPRGNGDGFIDHNSLGVTVYVRSTNAVRVKWPPEDPVVTRDLASVLVIRLGDVARVDILARNTVVDVNEGGGAVISPNSKFLRDDRKRMLTLAVHAYEWYKKNRATLSLSINSIECGYDVGDLITRLVLGKVKTVRTSRNTQVVDGSSVASQSVFHTITASDGSPIISSDGMPIRTNVVDSTPASSTPGAPIAINSPTFKDVNTIVSRVLFDFANFSTQIDTHFSELRLNRTFSDA